jgi:hypothetical protein
LACAAERHNVVSSLIDTGADVFSLDAQHRTPLYFASHNGDIKTIHLLLSKDVEINDGSLHEAARELRLEAVNLLLSYRHNPNYSSFNHNGRSALGELCAKASGRLDLRKTRLTMKALLDGGANPRAYDGGKSLIFLCLDNPDPCPITREALDLFAWSQIDEDFNQYRDSDGFCYSPTMYVLKGVFLGSKSSQAELYKLLKARGKDVFYTTKGPQPEDAINYPKDIALLEQRRRMHEVRDKEQDHTHAKRLLRERENAGQNQSITQKYHELKMAQDEEIAITRQRILEHERDAYKEHQENLINLDLDGIRQRNRLAQEHGASMAYQQQQALQARMVTERLMMQHKEEVLNRQLERQASMAKLMIESQNSVPAQIGWVEPDEVN